MKKLEIRSRKVEELHPRVGNPRTHSKRQIEQIAASIRRFGFVNPIIIDREGGLVAGHGRLAAAQLLGLAEVPTVQVSNMSQADVRAYVIADNRLAERAGWDQDLLRVEFAFLSQLEVDFDMTLTGFDLAEIDALLTPAPTPSAAEQRDDTIPEQADKAVTNLGDVWDVGPHRLVCGDATSDAPYATLLKDQKATMVFCDAPYNVPIQGHVSGLGKVQHREFPMASGEMTSAEFTSFLAATFNRLVRWSANGSIHFHCMDWRHAREIMDAGSASYSELKNLCVWAKTNAGMGSLYRSAHELVFVFKAGSEPHINNVELGKNGRFRTNVWTYAGANSFGRSRDSDLAMHPTVKPVAMVVDAILDCSRRGDIVLDAFAGSGTTLVAAHKTKRRGFGIELDPLYCDTIVRRLQSRSRLSATRVSDGVSFDDAARDHDQDQSEEVVA